MPLLAQWVRQHPWLAMDSLEQQNRRPCTRRCCDGFNLCIRIWWNLKATIERTPFRTRVLRTLERHLACVIGNYKTN